MNGASVKSTRNQLPGPQLVRCDGRAIPTRVLRFNTACQCYDCDNYYYLRSDIWKPSLMVPFASA